MDAESHAIAWDKWSRVSDHGCHDGPECQEPVRSGCLGGSQPRLPCDKDPRLNFLHLPPKHISYTALRFGLQEVYNHHHEALGVSPPDWRMLRISSDAASATSTTRCLGVVAEASTEPPRFFEVAYKGGPRHMG